MYPAHNFSLLAKKISWYVDVFQKLWYSFDDKEKFIKQAGDICFSNDRLLKEIKKVIYDIIVKNREEEFRPWRDFYIFKMPRGWRIILYKKSIIGDIWDHRFYDKALKNKI